MIKKNKVSNESLCGMTEMEDITSDGQGEREADGFLPEVEIKM